MAEDTARMLLGTVPAAAVVALAAVLLIPADAPAHIERAAYWPDPAPDALVTPPAGGGVPVARSLASALEPAPPGRTRVVCKPDSLGRGLRAVDRARKRGVVLRPTQPARPVTRSQARRHRSLLRRLRARCRFAHIQAAVFASGNNDRVVVMPGVYREEPSRAQPTNDPRCAADRGPTGAATFRYHTRCPNDQSLVYVQGRALSDTPPPGPPRDRRFGIPDEGPCVRCNLQIEGAGVGPFDVVIDAGTDATVGPRARTGAAKDVVVRVDRADGFVLRNVTTTHAREHGIYMKETDGYLLDDFGALYNGQYGSLTFASDHGVTSDCELAGHGDSGAYPGGAPDTVAQRIEPLPRLNQTITRCDLHHNATGFSGSMSNGVHLHHNEIYDNVAGILSTSLFPGGHPGYPQDGSLIEDNDIHSNNFNAYAASSDVRPIVPMPIGVGIVMIGGNDNTVRRNRMWDNWRRGAMQIALPDVFAGPNYSPDRVTGSTSHRNRYYGNVMGIAPDGAWAPNGVDFWWDESPGEQGNCWYGNGAVRTEPARLPAGCDNVSLGLSYALHFGAELLPCLVAGSEGIHDPNRCPWFAPPRRPGGGARVASAGRAGAAPRRPMRIGSFSTATALQVAACADWRAANRANRLGVVDRLEQIIRGERGDGRTLPDRVAYAAIDGRCRAGRRFGALLLYDLYAIAVGFAQHDGTR